LSYGGDRKKEAKLIGAVLPEVQMKEEKREVRNKEGREERNTIKCEHHRVSAASVFLGGTHKKEKGAHQYLELFYKTKQRVFIRYVIKENPTSELGRDRIHRLGGGGGVRRGAFWA